MPWVAAAIVVGGLGLIGVPLTAGFVGKWHLVLALIDLDLWLLAGIVLAGSLLAAAYVWKLVEVMYLSDCAAARLKPPPPTLVISSWILLGLTLFFGVNAGDPVAWAAQAARIALSGIPA